MRDHGKPLQVELSHVEVMFVTSRPWLYIRVRLPL